MQQCYGIGEVAASAGVTARTLRHYDHIGLLVADRDPANGYRVYRRAHLLRLQRILLLRDMGVPLTAIGDLLDDDVDDTAALHRHLGELEHARARLDRLIAAVRCTLETASIDRLDLDALFDGFSQRRGRFEQRLVQRFGEDARRHFRTAEQAMAGWGLPQHRRAAAEGRHLLQAFERLRRAGTRPDALHVAPLVGAHLEAVRQYWDATSPPTARSATCSSTTPTSAASSTPSTVSSHPGSATPSTPTHPRRARPTAPAEAPSARRSPNCHPALRHLAHPRGAHPPTPLA